MAKKKHTDPKAETAARIQRTEAYAERVRLMFTATVNQILALNKTLPKLEPGVMFSFDGQSLKKQQEVERLLRQLHSVATMAIQQGITLEWGQANAAADTLVKSMFGKEVLSSPQFSAWNNRNSAAMNAFIKRSEKGLNLSERVWQSVQQLRDEMEVAITVSLGEGESAQKLSQSVRQYLNDPDLMFRRFRYKAGEEPEYDENGNEIGKKIIWGRKWKKRIKKPDGTYGWIDYDRDSYKTGAGVYKSSAKNAMRVARTETNIAYRRADHERWQDMDFVLGQRVQMSKDHPKKDICDKLAGDYPKDFVFDGWHPQCFCYVTPITLPPEETAHLTEMFLNGEDWRSELARLKRGREITSYPENFKTWVTDNAANIQASRERGTEPYFIRNNAQVIDNIINPPKALTPQEIAAQRHAARTPEQEEKIRLAWQERKERIEAEKKKAHINNITASYGNRILGVMGDIPGVDTSALRAAIKAGNTDLIKEEAQKLRALGKQFKADAHSALGTAAEYGEVSGEALTAAINAGNIKSIWEQTKALQSQIKATQADEAALETLIPNAHDWHKKFTSADLHVVYDNVEKKLASLSTLSLAEQKKKLEFEISYVANPGSYKAGAKQYPTWEVAQNAYGKALAEVNYQIAINDITNKLKVVESWSLAHPKSKNVAIYLLEAQAAIANNEPLTSIQNKAQKAILEHQKRLAEQARRDKKKGITGGDTFEQDGVKYGTGLITRTTFGADNFTTDRKNNAVWCKSQSEAVTKYRDLAQAVFDTATPDEKEGQYSYTGGSGHMNRPLRGYNRGWSRSNFKGVGNVDLNNESSRGAARIKGLTEFIDKSSYSFDVWLQRGVDDSGLMGFLGTTDLDVSTMKSLIGKTVIDTAFMSCGSAKGTGFSGNILNVYCPRGTKMLYVEGHSAFNGENETIIQRNTHFRITKVEKSGYRWYIDMEVIAQI